MHKVHTPMGGGRGGRTEGRNDGKSKSMSLRFSSKRRGTKMQELETSSYVKVSNVNDLKA